MKEYVSLCHVFQHELTAITWSKDKTVTRRTSYFLFEF